MKKLITILLVCTLALAPAMALTDVATLTFTTFVGETINNTGMKITENVNPLIVGDGSIFDAEYFSSGTHLEINNSAFDNSDYDVEGTFSLLIRRQSGTGVTITVVANPLVSDTDHMQYTLNSDLATLLTVDTVAKSTTLTVPTTYSAGGGIIRYQKVFTYLVSQDIGALIGTYEGTMTFNMETF